MEFLVNGKVMTARVVDTNGTEYTTDFIGNHGGFEDMVLVEHQTFGEIWACDTATWGFWSVACESQSYINLKTEELKNEGVDLTDELADLANADLADGLNAQFALVYSKAVEHGLDA